MERRGDAAISFTPRHRVSVSPRRSQLLLILVDIDIFRVDDVVFAARLS